MFYISDSIYQQQATRIVPHLKLIRIKGELHLREPIKRWIPVCEGGFALKQSYAPIGGETDVRKMEKISDVYHSAIKLNHRLKDMQRIRREHQAKIKEQNDQERKYVIRNIVDGTLRSKNYSILVPDGIGGKLWR